MLNEELSNMYNIIISDTKSNISFLNISKLDCDFDFNKIILEDIINGELEREIKDFVESINFRKIKKSYGRFKELNSVITNNVKRRFQELSNMSLRIDYILQLYDIYDDINEGASEILLETKFLHID